MAAVALTGRRNCPRMNPHWLSLLTGRCAWSQDDVASLLEDVANHPSLRTDRMDDEADSQHTLGLVKVNCLAVDGQFSVISKTVS